MIKIHNSIFFNLYIHLLYRCSSINRILLRILFIIVPWPFMILRVCIALPLLKTYMVIIIGVLILIPFIIYPAMSTDLDFNTYTKQLRNIDSLFNIKRRYKTKENILKYIIENPKYIKYVPKKYKNHEVILAEKLS